MHHETARRETISGLSYAAGAFFLWGIVPLYWKMLKQVPAFEILAHRIVWSLAFVAILIAFYNRWDDLKSAFFLSRKRWLIFSGAILVSANWGVFIWAVNAGHVVDTSMGYYINPLLSVFLGMLVLRERLNFWQQVSLVFATAGVLIITFQYGRIPWVALSLAVSFALYGLVKKVTNIESLIGLTLETIVLAPLGLGYLIYLQWNGSGAFGNIVWWRTLLLAGAGLVTAIPLLWFARAVQRIPLTMVGFIQYLTPTMTLLLGVFLYHETFSPAHLVSFGFIWFALALFSCSQLKFMQEWQPRKFRVSTTP
jgi:chloramphenicol-sensitive protein RarD